MKKNLLKITLIFSIIILIISFFIFYFLNNKINLNKKNFEDSELVWQQEKDKRESTQLLNESIKKIEREKEMLEKHFAGSANIVAFLDAIEMLGKKAGAATEVTQVNVLKENDGLYVDMKALGSFEQIYKFLLLLENSPYELDTVSIDIERGSVNTAITKNNKIPEWSANLKMKLISFTQ